MPHPFKEIRTAGRHYSINDVAQITGLTRNVIIRTEQGLYGRPPDELMAFYCDLSGFDYAALFERYQSWQRWNRRQSGTLLLKALHHFVDVEWNVPSKPHPFRLFLEIAFPGCSQIGRAKKLCVQQSVLMKYEAGKTQHMPESIRVALGDAGLQPDEIHKLDSLGIVYGAHS